MLTIPGKYKKRKEVMPMVRFCVQVALHQIKQGKFFIIENPETSSIWYIKVMKMLAQQFGVTWDTLDMCRFGLCDPVTKELMRKATSLMHNFPSGVLNPLFKRCKNREIPNHHTRRQIQGHCPGHG